MHTTYFIIHGIKYVITYNNKQLEIKKIENNSLYELSDNNKEMINKLINNKTGYEYDSEKLIDIVNENNSIENKEYLLNFLNWLENCIPLDYRQNFYDNLSNLTTTLNIDLNLTEANRLELRKVETVGGYNTRNNSIIMNKESLIDNWRVALKTNDPNLFYWKHYSLTLLHELAHMASSKYDKITGISLCGFDTFPPQKLSNRNRGLTEGYTEVIAMTGIVDTIEVASSYYIECLLVNQLIQIIGLNIMQESYFGNKGTELLENELCKLINNKEKAFILFRNIEINYQIGNTNEKQNILANIQSSLLDYLEKKLDILSILNNQEEIDRLLYTYENMLITPEVLQTTGRVANKYEGITDSIIRFNEIKDLYYQKNYTDNKSVSK